MTDKLLWFWRGVWFFLDYIIHYLYSFGSSINRLFHYKIFSVILKYTQFILISQILYAWTMLNQCQWLSMDFKLKLAFCLYHNKQLYYFCFITQVAKCLPSQYFPSDSQKMVEIHTCIFFSESGKPVEISLTVICMYMQKVFYLSYLLLYYGDSIF